MNQHSHATGPVIDPNAAPLMIAPNEAALRLLESRRSVPLRALAAPGPTPDELDRLLALAIRVPDHGRLAPWRFIVIEGEARETLGRELDALYARQQPDLGPGKADMWSLYLMRAPLTVVLVSRPDRGAKVPEWNQALSAGCVGMALTVAATAMGFATQWLLKWPGRDPEAAALLGLREDEKVAGFIHIGRPTQIAPRNDHDLRSGPWSRAGGLNPRRRTTRPGRVAACGNS